MKVKTLKEIIAEEVLIVESKSVERLCIALIELKSIKIKIALKRKLTLLLECVNKIDTI